MGALEEATKTVCKAKNLKVFVDFLEAFKEEEELHIRNFLSPEDPKDFNLRNAALCLEAHAAAHLMSEMIQGKTNT